MTLWSVSLVCILEIEPTWLWEALRYCEHVLPASIHSSMFLQVCAYTAHNAQLHSHSQRHSQPQPQRSPRPWLLLVELGAHPDRPSAKPHPGVRDAPPRDDASGQGTRPTSTRVRASLRVRVREYEYKTHPSRWCLASRQGARLGTLPHTISVRSAMLPRDASTCRLHVTSPRDVST